jgi:hypothetical protein
MPVAQQCCFRKGPAVVEGRKCERHQGKVAEQPGNAIERLAGQEMHAQPLR